MDTLSRTIVDGSTPSEQDLNYYMAECSDETYEAGDDSGPDESEPSDDDFDPSDDYDAMARAEIE